MPIESESAAPRTAAADNTKIQCHRKLNRWISVFASPTFIFLAYLNIRHGNDLQAVLFFLSAVNASVALVMGLKISDPNRLMLLNRATSIIAFALLATSFIIGMGSGKIHIFSPWIYTYPLGVMLFFGHRIGFYNALFFCMAVTIIIMTLDLPSLSTWDRRMYQLNSTCALAVMLGITLFAEKIRMHVQHDLMKAQNESERAEKRQQQTNIELQYEIDLRIQSEKELTQSELRYRALFEESAVSLWEEDWSQLKAVLDRLPPEHAADLHGYFEADPTILETWIGLMQVTAVNRATLDLFEADSTAALLQNLPVILPPNRSEYFLDRIVALFHHDHYDTQAKGHTLNGRPLFLLINSTVPDGFKESWKKVFTSVFNVTDRVTIEEERKRVDQQLQYGRQIQAVATLAGGIAHQFNNALSVISGNLDLIRFGQSGDPTNEQFFRSLRSSTDRMSRLTDQLLAYAQGGKYQPRPFSANGLIRDVLNSERLLLPSSIQIHLLLDRDLAPTSGDTTQIKTVIEAVLSNAIESMPAGGEVAISTQNQSLEQARAAEDSPSPGDYTVITIEDRGIGMDEQTCQRIFEPFFTTKFVGRGLGMAAAYGIVKNHDGRIEVHSEPNKGTRVSIYLPSLE